MGNALMMADCWIARLVLVALGQLDWSMVLTLDLTGLGTILAAEH